MEKGIKKEKPQLNTEKEAAVHSSSSTLRERLLDKRPKSRRYIVKAFLDIRAVKDLEKMTVVEICERADVNKSTFYTYYHDVYDLSDQLEREVIQRIIETFPDANEIMDDVSQFTKDVLIACIPDRKIIHLLFSGSQSYKLPEKMVEAIKEHFFSIRPWHKGDMHHEVMLSYKIYGAYFALDTNPEFSLADRVDYISYLSGSFATHNV